MKDVIEGERGNQTILLIGQTHTHYPASHLRGVKQTNKQNLLGSMSPSHTHSISTVESIHQCVPIHTNKKVTQLSSCTMDTLCVPVHTNKRSHSSAPAPGHIMCSYPH